MKLKPGKHPDKETQEKRMKLIIEQVINMKYNNNVVVFMDPVHQTHNVYTGNCRQIKGKENTKTIGSNTGRRRLNIVGAVDTEGEMLVNISEENCDQERIKKFLKELRDKYKDKSWIEVHLDNARYQRAKAVQAYAKKLKIRLNYLPAYSPNLNLIERVWKWFKKKIVKNKYYENFDLFKETIEELFENISEHKGAITALINMKFEIL